MLYTWCVSFLRCEATYFLYFVLSLKLFFFIRWVEEANYIDITRPLYAALLPFPLNYYYPGRYEREAKNYIETMFLEDEDTSVIETYVSCDGDLAI